MVNRIAYQMSAAVLTLAALAVLAMLAAGVTRAVASPGGSTAKTPPKIQKTVQPKAKKVAAASKPAQKASIQSPFTVKRILEINEPFVHGFWIWDTDGAPEKGEIIITVDLKAESMSVFRDGYEIGAAVITFGDAKKPTPTGVFPITQKSRDHVSNIYGTPMPYMLRMTNDGISIHGADVKWGWGTRGCIGVPTEFAKLLFDAVELGHRVIVTNGKMLSQGDAIVAG